jgi:flavin-dependent dehydrogenase
MLALRLAASGRKVILLEKERAPHHKVCGEFLSQEAIAYLERVGIKPLALGAQIIDRVRLHSARHTVETRLPFTALSLSRRILDEALLNRAAIAGCQVRRGVQVERLTSLSTCWSAQLRGCPPVETLAAFLATGKHDLNDSPRGSGSQSDLVGFKMHFRLDRIQVESLCGAMELFLFVDGYGGLSTIEDGFANLCFVVRRSRLRKLGSWVKLLEAIRNEVAPIDERLHLARPCWEKPLAISPIPYGHLSTKTDGIWRLGDQAAVIPSFTGDGMSIAMHSAELAAEMYLAGISAEEYSRRLKDQLRPGMQVALALSKSMVTSTGRAITPIALALIPGAMSWVARKTRIPSRALSDATNGSGAGIHPSSPTLA